LKHNNWNWRNDAVSRKKNPVKIQSTLSFKSKLSPAHITQGKKVEIDMLKLSDLPGVMRNMGWIVAPKLMDRWFQGDAFVLHDDLRDKYDDFPLSILPEHYDDDIVTMDWALQFDRVVEAYDSIIADYATKAATKLLEKRLHHYGWPTTSPRLGNTSMTARELNATCQIQTAHCGKLTDTIDDFYGAIGRGFVQLAVVGHVYRDNFSEMFIIDNVGLYLKDRYEFEGFQFLGAWTKTKAFGKAEMLSRLSAATSPVGTQILKLNEPVFHVFNHHFRQYREKHGKGGDFVIYSDVKWLPGTDFPPILLDRDRQG
jgi:hypothetical protein